MKDALLVINAGSSSIKFALFECSPALHDKASLAGCIDGIGAQAHIEARGGDGAVLVDVDVKLPGELEAQHAGALAYLLRWLDGHDDGFKVVAAGHRVVHGGRLYDAPLRVTPLVADALAELIPLAPLHQPHNLAAIRAITRLMPRLPQVACFDTAFHRSQSRLTQIYGLPRAITTAGVRRYGFHGLSYEYLAGELPRLLGDTAQGRVVVAHLGNGASMCAMNNRRSVATTMGFGTADGLIMGTRSGSLDPGVLLYLMQEKGMDAAAVSQLIYKRSGLLGVSGLSSDMRKLLAANTAEAAEAVALFCDRVNRELGSLAAALRGLDALVFTGGIGAHAAPVREQVCRDAAWLGVSIDRAANACHATSISTTDSAVKVLVVPTNEELMIARHTAKLLSIAT